MFNRVADWYKSLPEQKKYVELITAVLSVPVLLSVLTLNISNINAKKSTEADTVPTEVIRENVVYVPVTGLGTAADAPIPTQIEDADSTPGTSTDSCVKEIGPIEIASPHENEIVTSNPVRIQVGYEQGDYCSVVWSYRINGGAWSDFDDSSIALFDMQPGVKNVEVKIKSLAAKQEKTLTRSFEYAPSIAPDNSPDDPATPSAGS